MRGETLYGVDVTAGFVGCEVNSESVLVGATVGVAVTRLTRTLMT